MAGYLDVTLVGNVGRDTEFRFTQDGTAVANFTVAVTKRRTDKNSGDKIEKTTWIRVTAWRNQAEFANTYIKKGQQVLVRGYDLEASPYMDKNNNQPAASLQITADAIELLGQRQENTGDNDFAPPDTQGEIPF